MKFEKLFIIFLGELLCKLKMTFDVTKKVVISIIGSYISSYNQVSTANNEV